VATSKDHYESHLAPVYSWMAGGVEPAAARAERELDALGLLRGESRYAVDLGAGFGMHTLPLARHGWGVLAIDSSAILLRELERHAAGLDVRVVDGDLLAFARYLDAAPNLVLCMGDTLTHLPSREAVESLFADVHSRLADGGVFVTSFRDYTSEPAGTARCIPVKSDAERILTCFLEYTPDTVRVHDILHERLDDDWRMSVSDYTKLRLSPGWVNATLSRIGFDVTAGTGLAGMVCMVGVKA
jgi:hypothetical protein